MSVSPRSERRQSGQAIVVMIGVILASIALVATIVDGGNVLAQQRIAQNGVDATAEAGAVILAERLAGAAAPSGGWDLNIAARLAQTAAANNVHVEAAYYTDICGIPLKADGSGAIHLDRREDLATALQVGNGSHVLPGGTATAPDCPNRLVGPVAGGVLAIAGAVLLLRTPRAGVTALSAAQVRCALSIEGLLCVRAF